METLRSHLSKVRVPEPSSRIYKQECCVSFSTPRSEGGLFVDMCTFLAFGKEYVTWNYLKTGNPIYLDIQETPKQARDNQPHKKPKVLAIGTESESSDLIAGPYFQSTLADPSKNVYVKNMPLTWVKGGFQSKETEYEVTYSIVVLPDFISIPYPSVELPEKVRLAVDGVLAAVGEERKEVVAEVVAAWTADKKQVSPYILALQQLRNGVTVLPTGWKCSNCDKTENLWMNLTDGTVSCGRGNCDWSRGNNHASEHCQEKLGSITDDLKGADLYIYAEDDSVEEQLADQLAHIGIDFSTLRKKEMRNAEQELDQNTNFDWNRIQEKEKELEPLFGPGFTGLSNLGNSCYLASVMQVVFSIKDFQRFYYENLRLDDAFKQAPADPTRDLQMQLSKLAHGILSGNYSVPSIVGSESDAAEELKDKNTLTSSLRGQDGIPPRMFKSLIGRGHPEFSSSRQQDALEFFEHLMDQVEKSRAADAGEDPSRCFKFCLKERIMCSVTKKVKYTWKTDNVLLLNVPLRAAVNKDEMTAYEKRVAEKELAGEKSDEEIVCPRAPLAACLESFSAPEEIQDFFSSAINARTTAIKTTRLATFPNYLVLHMRKFALAAGGVPKELDVFVDVPDEIDISDMCNSALKPDEQLLPDTPDEIPEQAGPTFPDHFQLAGMNFPTVQCEKAAVQTLNSDVEEAMSWLLPHPDDSDIDELSIRTGSSRASSVAPGGDTERAAERVWNHPEESIAMERDVGTGNRDTQHAVNAAGGSGKYQLLAFVSHMGTSSQSGHYVAYVRKNDRWVVFNDCEVALCGDPPKDRGYLYFFQRMPS